MPEFDPSSAVLEESFPQPKGPRYPVQEFEQAPTGFKDYLKNNPDVAGMAIGGGLNGSDPSEPRSILVNPFNPHMKDETRRKGLIQVEAARHLMSETNYNPNFDITPEQREWQKTLGAYSSNDPEFKKSIVSRLVANDKVPGATPQQLKEAQSISQQLGFSADFDPSTAVLENDFDPSSAVEEADAFAPESQAALYNTFQNAIGMDRDVLGAIRQDERKNNVVQKESRVAALTNELQREGLNPTLVGERMVPGGTPTPAQAERLTQLETLTKELPNVQREMEYSRSVARPPGEDTGSSVLSRFLPRTIEAQVNKELFQGGKDAAGATAGGALGARMLMGARGGPIGALLPIVGAIGGSMVGGAVQDEATQLLENSPEVTAERQARQAEMSGSPLYKAGGMASLAALFRPSATVVKAALRGDANAIQNIGIGGALGAGTAAIHPILEGRMPTTGEIMEGGGLGLAFHQPTRLAQRLFGFHPIEIQPDVRTDTARTPLGTIDGQGRLVEPATPEGKALRALSGLEATEPVKVDPPEVRDARQLVDEIAVEHTDALGNTDWPAVKAVMDGLQVPNAQNAELRVILENAQRIAGERVPVPTEVTPDVPETDFGNMPPPTADTGTPARPGGREIDGVWVPDRITPASEIAVPAPETGIPVSPEAPVPVAEVLSPVAPPPRRVKLGASPQTYEVIEELPRQPGDLPEETFFKVRNERDGKEQVVESRDLRDVRPKGNTLAQRGPEAAVIEEPVNPIPEPYAKAAELPVADAAQELGLPPQEVQRRARLVEEVNAAKYQPEELAGPEVRNFPPLERPEGGAIGSGGGQRRGTKLLGGTPSGSTDWIEIAPWWRRPGFEREGASRILQGRQKNPIGKQLGRATDRQFDVEADLVGRMTKDVQAGMKGMGKPELTKAFDEIELYLREKENGRQTPALSANGQRLLNAWQDVAEFSGLLAQARGVKVADAGGYRPMRLIGREYVPRMIAPEVANTIRDPKSNPAEFNRLVQELATQRQIPVDEAAKFLNEMAGGKGRFASNDFMGNIEVARQERLPESFYDYDLRRVMAKYISGYARRMGQIIAYGQRLGDGGRVQKNLWDIARDEVRGGDKTTAQWINEAEAQATGERVVSGAGKAGQRLQSLATGLLLSNPTSTVPRNLLSGMQTTAELFGYARTLKGTMDLAKASERVGAKELGIVRDDLATILHADQLEGSDNAVDKTIRSVSDALLKGSGYNASEQFVRTSNFLTASNYARDAAKAIAQRPNSAFAKEARGFLQRMGVDPAAVAAEGGEWRTGAETQRFIRQSINQSQGGYKFNQVPLWAGTPAGRFFYQFGRWGTQRAQNIWENALKPALIGDDIKVNGVPMTQRNFKPLMRMAAGTVLLGETFGALSKVLFDRDRKDASLTEIGKALGEEPKRAMTMIGGRLLNDVIMGGGLGIWGTPLDLAKSAKDQSRLKNPAEPPAAAGIKALVEFGLSGLDQGTVTGDDVKRLLQSFVPGPTAVVDVARNALDESKYEAENDVRTLRNAGLRFAQAKGLDVGARGGGSDMRKTERTPVFTKLRDAILVGDIATAKKTRDDYLATLTGKKKADAAKAIKASIRARQPFRVGPFTTEAVKRDFLNWAKGNLSKEDQDQITRTQARYENTAKQLGLW